DSVSRCTHVGLAQLCCSLRKIIREQGHRYISSLNCRQVRELEWRIFCDSFSGKDNLGRENRHQEEGVLVADNQAFGNF
ncbi:MAG: hypothetical protein ACI9FD_003575, partial [Gammaproteobacteria bacterium]